MVDVRQILAMTQDWEKRWETLEVVLQGAVPFVYQGRSQFMKDAPPITVLGVSQLVWTLLRGI